VEEVAADGLKKFYVLEKSGLDPAQAFQQLSCFSSL
jgi:hypothetical protein